MTKLSNAILFVIISFVIVVLLYMPAAAQDGPSMASQPAHSVNVKLSACNDGGATVISATVTSWDTEGVRGENDKVRLEYQYQDGNFVSGFVYWTDGAFTSDQRTFGASEVIVPEVSKVKAIVTVLGLWGDDYQAGQVFHTDWISVESCPAPTATPTATSTQTPTVTPTRTPTVEPTKVATVPAPAEGTSTRTATPTATPTHTPTYTPTTAIYYGSVSVRQACNDTESAIFVVSNHGQSMTGYIDWALSIDGENQDSGAVKLAAGESMYFGFKVTGVLRFEVSSPDGVVASSQVDTSTCIQPTAEQPTDEPFQIDMRSIGASAEVGGSYDYQISCSGKKFVIMEIEFANGQSVTRTGDYCNRTLIVRNQIDVARFYDVIGNMIGRFKFSVDSGGAVYLPLVVR